MASPKLPNYVPPQSGLGRPAASQINSQAPTSQSRTLTIAGFGEVVPVVYGEDRVGGIFIAGPIVDGTGAYVAAICWSIGEPYGIEGVQSLLIDGVVATSGGSTAVTQFNHYNGLQTTVDPILAARFTAFSDKFEGLAYTAIRIPARSTGGIPRIEALVRGRKVLDPRVGTNGWSRNPALAINDFVTNTKWGMGKTVRGLTETANRCDELVGGSEIRCQMGLTIKTSSTENSVLDLLSAYAECFYEYDGDGVLLVPDAPAGPVRSLNMSDIRGGSLKLSGNNLTKAPTSISVKYLNPSGGAAPWAEAAVKKTLPGVVEGLTDDIPSEINMPGVHRFNEASRKAIMRLNRLQVPASIAFQMFDDGIAPEKGDVIELPVDRGLNYSRCRILSKEMPQLGIYQFTGELYQDSYYDDSTPTPGIDATIPVGGIVPMYTGAIPAGWARFTAADGKYIRGALASGATGGSDSLSFSGSTNFAGDHSGSVFRPGPGSGVGAPNYHIVSGVNNNAGLHSHTWSANFTATGTNSPLSQDMILVEKTGTADQLPPNCAFLAQGALLSVAITEINDFNGRLIKSNAASAAVGRTFPVSLNAVTSTDGAHAHGAYASTKSGLTSGSSSYPNGGHSHTVLGSLNLSPKTRTVALYVASVSAAVVPGAIIGWKSGAIPPRWRLCTELENCFIKASAVTAAGVTAGTATATYSGGTTESGAHSHINPGSVDNSGGYLHADSAGGHVHVASATAAYIPAHYCMAFIEYTGVL